VQQIKYLKRINLKLLLENQGLEKAANFGVSQANGKYFTRLDADDYLRLDYLRVMVPFLEHNKKLAFVYSDYYKLRDNTSERVELPEFNIEEITKRGDFLATGTLYRKEIIDMMGGYNEDVINCGLENYELILKIILKFNLVGHHVKLPLFYYRIHNRNMSLVRKQAIIKYGDKICEDFGLNAYTTNRFHPNKII
jgi:glycosyltransferase involved in cell wall biosynthesis